MVKSYADILALQSRMEVLSRLVMLMLTMTFLLAVALLFVSCEHKELEYGGAADITVRFDWTRCPETTAQTMSMMAFNGDASVVQIPFNNPGGGTIVLPAGEYQFIGLNDDTESLFPRGEKYDDFEIFAQHTTLAAFSPMFAQRRTQSIPRAPETEDQPIIIEPTHLWTAAIPGQYLLASQHNDVTLKMQSAIKTFSFTVNNVENIQYVTDIAASLSGMSESWMPARGNGSDTESIIPFTLERDAQGTLTGTVRTFGHCPHHTGSGEPDDGEAYDHKLVIYVQMSDGNKYYYTFDITEEIHEADPGALSGGGGGTDPVIDTPTVIDIQLDDIPLPKPLQNGSGIHPEVDTWTEIDINVPM